MWTNHHHLLAQASSQLSLTASHSVKDLFLTQRGLLRQEVTEATVQSCCISPLIWNTVKSHFKAEYLLTLILKIKLPDFHFFITGSADGTSEREFFFTVKTRNDTYHCSFLVECSLKEKKYSLQLALGFSLTSHSGRQCGPSE